MSRRAARNSDDEPLVASLAPDISAWSELLGHWDVRQRLTGSEPFAAMLFSGPEGLGKRLTALWYLAWLNCRERPPVLTEEWQCECLSCRKLLHGNHPDLMVLERVPGKISLGVGEVREGIAQLDSKPYESGYRMWIIADAERLTEEAQNALLKTLEEPPPRNLIVLSCGRETALLPTVVSRCRILRFRPVEEMALALHLETRGSLPESARVLGRLSEGRPGLARRLASDATFWNNREQVLALLQNLTGGTLWKALETAQRLEALKSQPPDPRRDLEQVLTSCEQWYRDLLMTCMELPEAVLNLHHTDALQRAARDFSAGKGHQALSLLAEAREQLDANVLPRFLLQSLCLGLRGL